MRFVFFINLLTVIFIGLKITGLITWSWLYVLLPSILLLGLLGCMLMISIITIIIIVTYDIVRGDKK
jgi:hypothetical protein